MNILGLRWGDYFVFADRPHLVFKVVSEARQAKGLVFVPVAQKNPTDLDVRQVEWPSRA